MFVSAALSPRSNAKPETWPAENRAAYAHLLGAYLGNGRISNRGSTPGLHLDRDINHPGIIEECASSIENVVSGHIDSHRHPHTNCLRLTCHNVLWPVLFPQPGPDRKPGHEIELVGWQQEIVNVFPEKFLRGLIHSDGSDRQNTFTVHLKGGAREYSCPRYFFTNPSEGIRKVFTDTCDQLEVRWTVSNRREISISDRDSVAFLDTFIGPKF